MNRKTILKLSVATFIAGGYLTAASVASVDPTHKLASTVATIQTKASIAISIASMNWKLRSTDGLKVEQNTIVARFNNTDGVDDDTTGSVNSSFFRTSAIPFSNLGAQKDWNRVRTAEFDSKISHCKTSACESRVERAFKAIGSLENKSFYEKLQAVNKFVNSNISYATDQRVYLKKDFWAPAKQTLELGRGDCEDFAILKHALLVKAGVPASSLTLIILKDTSRSLFHAILAVSTNKGHLILDNVARNVYRDISINYYQPMFSFSNGRSWIHGVDRSTSNVLAQSSANYGAIAPGESSFDESSMPTIDATWIEGLRPSFTYDNSEPANWRY